MNLVFKIHELIRFFEDLITGRGRSLLKEILFMEHIPRPNYSQHMADNLHEADKN